MDNKIINALQKIKEETQKPTCASYEFDPTPTAEERLRNISNMIDTLFEELELNDKRYSQLKDKMLFLSNEKHSFRCSCGCNVFKEYETGKYSCNACAACYEGLI